MRSIGIKESWTGLRHRAYVEEFDIHCDACETMIEAGEWIIRKRTPQRIFSYHFNSLTCAERVKKTWPIHRQETPASNQ